MSGGPSQVDPPAAIYAGFLWADALNDIVAIRPLRVLGKRRVGWLTGKLNPHLEALSPRGWYPGIPDRTLLLPRQGLRLVYGGSMGSEIGVRSLDGSETKGFFLSGDVLLQLRALEHLGIPSLPRRSARTPRRG